MFSKNKLFIIFSVIFLSLMVGNYTLNRSFAKEILINEQLSILKSSSSRIEKWLENKKSSMQAINSLIAKFDPVRDEATIKDIFEKSQEIANFSSVYAGYENNVTISGKIFNRPPDYIPTLRPWYINTAREDKIYITRPYVDVGLQISVISICESIKEGKVLKGVLCGILSFSDIKNEILDLRLDDGFIFLIDENFNILLHPDSKFELTKAKFDVPDLDILKTSNYETNDEILTFNPIENSKLTLVAKTPKKDIYKKINEQFIINLAIYVASVVSFLLLMYFYNKKDKESERMLFQQTKMAELGEMIAAISHQWIQPLNSLGIFLGNLVQFKRLGKLSDEVFYENIKRSLSNIDYMANTMDIFKNFYRFEASPQSFDIKQAIEETVFILFSQKSKIEVKINLKRGVDTACQNYINEFKQIIACLIQNSKQALQTSKNKKRAKIVVSIRQNDTHFEIRVIDNADGIDRAYRDKIFTPFLSTKGGGGLGLYISKLIANKKLNGDLTLVKSKNPTIFMLKISKKVKDDR
ncbi:sensor histidine kinase [Campylobacter curvus]|uniref:sensor histidine kinase n=1 Tax=Campylobacter curvus TaxID=200 RepID=UPI001470169C|nr:sensor histidine kinase [Campylobacter curvus]